MKARRPKTSPDQLIGKRGSVSGAITPGSIGEVMLSIRGGNEAYMAVAADKGATIELHTSVVVIDQLSTRTVSVSALE